MENHQKQAKIAQMRSKGWPWKMSKGNTIVNPEQNDGKA
jgi:phage gp16-like protein